MLQDMNEIEVWGWFSYATKYFFVPQGSGRTRGDPVPPPPFSGGAYVYSSPVENVLYIKAPMAISKNELSYGSLVVRRLEVLCLLNDAGSIPGAILYLHRHFCLAPFF